MASPQPLIEVYNDDADIIYRSRQRSVNCSEPESILSPVRSKKIRQQTQILLLQDLDEEAEASSEKRRLLEYAKELRILKDPQGHYYTRLPWFVKSMPVSQLTLPEHQEHSGAFEWIGTDTDAKPKYLWDSREGRTVLATEEILTEGYIAVSWTWGRYQTKSRDGKTLLKRTSRGVGQFPGLPRWNVPQTRLAENGRGKDLLHDLKVCLGKVEAYRYFWVDLLCINQERPILLSREIAKQASIFGNAAGVLCYLWQQERPEDLTDALEGIGKLLNWALVFGDSSSLTRADERSMDQLFPQGSARHEESAYHKRFGQLKDDHWFTSLWALQEIVLAPAGVWMTRYGDMCKINGQILTTRLMAIVVRLMSWAAAYREEIWQDTRKQSSLSPKEWEALQAMQAIQDDTVRLELGRAFDEIAKTWQPQTPSHAPKCKCNCCPALMPSTLFEWRFHLPRLPHPNVTLPHRTRYKLAEPGFQGLVVEADRIQQRSAHWLFKRYRVEQALRDEIRKWSVWSFGHACIDVSLPTTRAAIIVGGAKRSIMEGHDQSREKALLAALKVEAPEWVREGAPMPVEVELQRSKDHLSPLLLNTILQAEETNALGTRLFYVTHNLPRRTSDVPDMNDFDETEWDHTEFEADFVLEEELHESDDDTYQALTMRSDRPVQRAKYKFHGHERWAEIVPGGLSNLTDMLPDSASMIAQQILHFATDSTTHWKSSKGWHMHKHGFLHIPASTEVQHIRKHRTHRAHGRYTVHLRPNGGDHTEYEVRNYTDLRSVSRTQPWLEATLGTKHNEQSQGPRFRFLPLGSHDKRSRSRSPSPHSHTSDQSHGEQETIGIVLVTSTRPTRQRLSALRDPRRSRSPQGSPQAGHVLFDDDVLTADNVWHKFGTYRATGLSTELSQEPDGFFVASYAARNALQGWTKTECGQLLSAALHKSPASTPGSQSTVQANGNAQQKGSSKFSQNATVPVHS